MRGRAGKDLVESTSRTNTAAWLDFKQDKTVERLEEILAEVTGTPTSQLRFVGDAWAQVSVSLSLSLFPSLCFSLPLSSSCSLPPFLSLSRSLFTTAATV